MFGLRFFSALAWVIAAIVSAVYAKKRIGTIASLIVLIGYSAATLPLMNHCIRAGDADALLCMFSAIAYIFMIRFTGDKAEPNNKSVKYLIGACLCFSFGFLAKSWQAGIIALVIILELFISRSLFKLSWKTVLLCLTAALGPIFVWAISRYSKDGMQFFTSMFQVDLLNRSSTTLENHYGDVMTYVNYLNTDYSTIVMTVIILIGLLFTREDHVHIARVGLLGVFTPLVLFSLAQTKCAWYIYLIYPPLILLTGIGAQNLVNLKKTPWAVRVVAVMLVVALLGYGVWSNVNVIREMQPSVQDADLMSFAGQVEKGTAIYKWGGIGWSQREILLLEWLDLTPREGGEANWIDDENGYLLTFVENNNGETIVSGDTWSIIEH